MSNSYEKEKNAKRRYKDEIAVKRQVKIAKQHGMNFNDSVIKEPHRLSKHHAMDCGNPHCYLCGNPRKIFKELTTQEKRLYQDTDKTNDKHSNGLLSPDE